MLIVSSCVALNDSNRISFRGIPNDTGEISKDISLYHGAYSWQIDEFEALLIMLGIREYAAVSPIVSTMLTNSLGKNFLGPDDFRDSERFGIAIDKTDMFIATLKKSERSVFLGLDYLYMKSNSESGISGEGYPPVPEEETSWSILEEIYDPDKYPGAYRYVVFTSPNLNIARKYGKIILKLRDLDQRGLSLPHYCSALHGTQCLVDTKNESYWAPLDYTEYVFPGYILSDEVEEVLIALAEPENYKFAPIEYRLQATKFNEGIVVTLFRERDYSILAEYTVGSQGRILYREYDEKEFLIKRIRLTIEEFNCRRQDLG